jgi:hypothetical protein
VRPSFFPDEAAALPQLVETLGQPAGLALQLFAEDDVPALALRERGWQVIQQRSSWCRHSQAGPLLCVQPELLGLHPMTKELLSGRRFDAVFCASAVWRHPSGAGSFERLIDAVLDLCAQTARFVFLAALLPFPEEPSYRVLEHDPSIKLMEHSVGALCIQNRYRSGAVPEYLQGPALDCQRMMDILRRAGFEGLQMQPLADGLALVRAYPRGKTEASVQTSIKQ